MIVSVQGGIGIGVPRKGNLELFLNTTGLISCVGFLIETDTHLYLAHITPPSETDLEKRSEIERRRMRASTLIAEVLNESIETMRVKSNTIVWRMNITLFVLDEGAMAEAHFKTVHAEVLKLTSTKRVPVECLGYDALYVRVRDGAFHTQPPQNTVHKNIYLEGAWEDEVRRIEPSVRREFGFATDEYDVEMAHKERHVILTRTPALLTQRGVANAWVVDTTY
ncbi:hypothetical protein D7V80_05335 [Corallococcus sp. CA054B]|uniref:hypothetical protein n=1 Tax=Corallococcus sp. CA054B TaxID=2316734 RepID=UPI000EA014BA|nr:hypothetical protein [Corallococcus sp. CA054B]RKG70444.1 hypothetical protein D7V80_05335 [Corallococcus sp. CA054B]